MRTVTCLVWSDVSQVQPAMCEGRERTVTCLVWSDVSQVQSAMCEGRVRTVTNKFQIMDVELKLIA